MNQDIFQHQTADMLERKRQRLRDQGNRLTFDCWQAIVQGEYVRCRKGIDLGGLLVRDSLAGISPGVCQVCMEKPRLNK